MAFGATFEHSQKPSQLTMATNRWIEGTQSRLLDPVACKLGGSHGGHIGSRGAPKNCVMRAQRPRHHAVSDEQFASRPANLLTERIQQSVEPDLRAALSIGVALGLSLIHISE